jgi:prepilin-type N-terminal cleavage/methylation domain-containing protein
MDTTMRHKKSVDNNARRKSRGFSLIEVMIAMVVLTVGLLAVIASFATAIAATQSAQEDLIARHKALDAMESIYTARNSQQIPFTSIANQANGGIFKGGPQPLLCAGPDGLVGTGDDVACTTVAGAVCPNGGVECMVLPGPDGILGNADDQIMSLANFRRTITISQVLQPNGQVNPNLMAITIAVTYTKAGWPARTYAADGLMSSYH